MSSTARKEDLARDLAFQTIKADKAKAALVDIVCSLGALFLSIVINSFVVMKIWNWYFVTIGAPRITISVAAGISIFTTYLTIGPPDLEKKRRPTAIAFSQTVAVAAFTLLIAWIGTWFL